MLAGYQRLAALRRELPELTDPRFGSARADEADRRLTLERGRVVVHVNLGSEPWEAGPAAEVLFRTDRPDAPPAQVEAVVVPPGNGMLVRR